MQYAKKFKRGLKVFLHAPLKKNLQMFCFPRTMNWIDLDWSCVHVTSFYFTIMDMYTQRIHAVAIYGNARTNKNHHRNTEGSNHTTIYNKQLLKRRVKCLIGCAICQKVWRYSSLLLWRKICRCFVSQGRWIGLISCCSCFRYFTHHFGKY